MTYDDLEKLRQAAQLLAVQVPRSSEALLQVSRMFWSSVTEGVELPERVSREAAEIAGELESETNVESSVENLPPDRRDELIKRLTRIADELECQKME